MRYLIVANQTLNSQQLADTLRMRAAEGATHFHFVVPATSPQDQASVVEGDGDAVEIANERLKSAIERFGELGPSVSGEVGTEDPFQAIRDAVDKQRCDCIIVVTLPKKGSRWMRRDVPSRLRREFRTLLVDHIELRS